MKIYLNLKHKFELVYITFELISLKYKFEFWASLHHFGHLMRKLFHWKRPWNWGWLKGGGEGDDRTWDGWMASPSRWRWVWASSGNWWWTGKPGMLESIGSQRVRHDWTDIILGGRRFITNIKLSEFLIIEWSIMRKMSRKKSVKI